MVRPAVAVDTVPSKNADWFTAMVAGETVNAAVGAAMVPPTVTALVAVPVLPAESVDGQRDREGAGAREAVRLGDAAAERRRRRSSSRSG